MILSRILKYYRAMVYPPEEILVTEDLPLARILGFFTVSPQRELAIGSQ